MIFKSDPRSINTLTVASEIALWLNQAKQLLPHVLEYASYIIMNTLIWRAAISTAQLYAHCLKALKLYYGETVW